MAPPDPPVPHPANPAVPDMVSDYRAQLDALRHQARDLARMRADVLAAADRESADIVTSARSDIREVLVKARRELLVLAAQVQAVTEQDVPDALGTGDDTDAAHHRARLTSGAASEARQEVRHVLSEARPDLDALAVEAKILRANLLALRAPDAPGHRQATAPVPPDIDLPPAPAAPPVQTASVAPPEPEVADASPGGQIDDFAEDAAPRVFGADAQPSATIDERPDAARPTRTTSPVIRGFDSTRRNTSSNGRVFVGAFAALAALVVAGTGWWMYAQRTASPDTSTATPVPAPALPPAAETGTAAAAVSTPVEPAAPESPSLVIEARGESWIRAQVDGRPDAGRVFRVGETRTITGASRVSVRAGDAGAVYVRLNGGDIEPLGPAGRPLTRDFVLVDAPEEPRSKPDAAPPTENEPDSPTSLETAPAPLAAPRASNPPVAGPAPFTVPTASPQPEPPNTAASVPAHEDELVALSRRWLDAYLSGNSSTMLAVSGGTPDIRDQRPPNERTAIAAAQARRIFETPRLQRGADIGVFSVRMTERPTGAATAPERVALVSQVWMRRTGKWQLIDVRIVSESHANPTP